jgi:hypothetical protein
MFFEEAEDRKVMSLMRNVFDLCSPDVVMRNVHGANRGLFYTSITHDEPRKLVSGQTLLCRQKEKIRGALLVPF